MSDEIYSRILYEDAEFCSMLEYPSLKDRLIVLDGWSKTYAMTGWRIGYGVWPSEYAKIDEKIKQSTIVVKKNRQTIFSFLTFNLSKPIFQKQIATRKTSFFHKK